MIVPLILSMIAVADDSESDVTATAILDRPRTEVAAHLRSTADLASLLPEACVSDWEHGVTPMGPARMTYRILSFKRRLTAKIVERDPDHVIELDHEGTKGFVTRFELKVVEPARTEVTITTYLNPPGWPFRRYYADKVKPLWTACYEDALTALETR